LKYKLQGNFLIKNRKFIALANRWKLGICVGKLDIQEHSAIQNINDVKRIVSQDI